MGRNRMKKTGGTGSASGDGGSVGTAADAVAGLDVPSVPSTPDSPPPPPPPSKATLPQSAETYKNAGNQFFASQNYAEAIISYSNAISLDSTNAILYSNRSAALLAKKSPTGDEVQLAVEDAYSAISLKPDWFKAYFRHGNALRQMRRFKQANESYLKGLAIEATNGELLKAVEDMKKLLDNPSVPPVSTIAPVDSTDLTTTASEIAAAESGTNFEVLEEWLLEGGATFPHLYMKKYDEINRGVHCLMDIPPETNIMEIPRKFLITVEDGKRCPIGRKCIEAKVDFSASKHCFLSIFILWDRENRDSFFQPYYRILPKSCDNMPIFWSAEELRLLEGSYMIESIEDRKVNILQDYRHICDAAPEFKRYSLQDFSWARMMVASRNFGINVDGARTDAMVPYADMLNHYRPRETKWEYYEKTESFIITSLQTLSCGNQVYDSYGKKCNSRFLLNYGFSVENNFDSDGTRHNEIRLLLDLGAREYDPYFDTKLQLIGDQPSDRSVRVSMHHDLTEGSREAFSYLRFIVAADQELLLLPMMDQYYDLTEEKKAIKPINARNEIEVLKLLSLLMQVNLQQYPTTFEEDVALLESGKLEPFSNERSCVILRKGEKEVAKFWMSMSKLSIPLLQMNYTDCKKLVTKIYNTNKPEHKPKEDYINKVVLPLVKKKDS